MSEPHSRSASTGRSAKMKVLTLPYDSAGPVAMTCSPKSAQTSYGHYTFKNLKTLERPQPAPATPSRPHHPHVSRGSIDQQTTQSRSKLASPSSRRPMSSSSGSVPFFGEVASPLPSATPGSVTPAATTTFVPRQLQFLPDSYPNLRHSPQSRIPVATRRLSATSDLSSLKSVKYTPTRPTSRVNTAPPPSICRNSIEPCATFPVPVATAGPAFGQPIPSAVAYREHHEQDKYDAIIGTRDGSSLPAVVTPSPTPVSPRLRNSRQRQPLQPSQGPSNRSPGTGGQHDYFPSANASGVKKETKKKHDQLSSTHISIRQCITDSSLNCDEVNPSCSSSPVQRLSLQTSTSSDPPPLDLPLGFTEFNESPVLVNTGTASMTSPAVRHEPQQKLPMPTVYQRSIQDIPTPSLGIQSSEGSVTESIPVMLSNEVSSQHQTLALEQFGELLQPVSYCDMQPNAAPYECHDSSTRPYSTGKKYPLCSAHSTPDVISNSLALHQDIHVVLESVLSQYRHMQMISPEFALRSKERVQRVSPVAVQHSEWASKEATETFLARMLHDSNEILSGSTKPQSISAVPENLLLSHCPQELSHLTPALEGTSVVCSQPRQCLPHSVPSIATSIQENASQFNHSLSNVSQNTMTSISISDPPSSPTTSFNLPHPALDHGAHGFAGPSIPPDDMPSCVQPPRPTYSPPPPPPPSQPSTEHQQAASSSPSPSLRASTIDNKFNMHPARARTPTFSTLEQSLQNTNGSSQILKAAHMVSPEVEVFPISQIDTTQQALVKRYRILEELLTTEHQFCIDMMIAHNIFEATAQNLMTEKEKKLLFSNCKDLEKFSLSLFRAFKKASKPIIDYEIPPPTGPWNRDSSDKRPFKTVESYLPRRNSTDDTEDQYANCTPENDRLTTIGQVFLDNKDKMERLYTTYFLNQENASLYIKKNQNNCDLSGWVIACFEQVQNMTQAWDLDSLLLKPCQRLLKYPLLLESLANASDPNHPDLMNIRNARKELLAINARINDAKARSDTFRAAASEGKKERSKGKGIGKTFVKAFIPKPDKNKAYDEADKAFKDQEYKSREQKFGGHFFQLQIVIRDFEQYLDAITEHYLQLNVVFLGFITVCEVAPSICPEIESTWRTWAMAHFELQNKALEQHKVAVRNRVLKPVGDLWEMWVSYQKTIEQRKKYLLYYVKYKQMIARGEKVDLELEDLAQKFIAINETLKHELPLLYERTKVLMRILMTLFMCLQKDWYKTCSKKILPLLESEPQHTTSLRYDLDSYVERFEADYKPMQNLVHRLGIINRSLLADISIMTSPTPTMSDEAGSSRNSSSRRTASIGSDVFPYDPRPRNNGGGHVTRLQSRNVDNLPRSSPIGPAYPSLYQVGPTGRSGPGPTSLREARALGPVSDNRDATAIHCIDEHVVTSSPHEGYCVTDGVVDLVDRSPLGPGTFDFPPQLGASFLSTTLPTRSHNILENSPQRPGSLRTSRIFNSALPMSDSPIRGSTEDLLTTPPETEEPEVLFLAASLFEFNIAHDRREGGIPYLVYVPGEIFDVIGMKGELWLARNQDDSSKTIGWIWEKHFARILPEDA